MTIQQAIEKAIEGGWLKGSKLRSISEYDGSYLPQVAFFTLKSDETSTEKWHRDVLALFSDPLFWQSLGKAMGWEEYACEWCGGTEEKPSMEGDVSLCKSCGTTLEEVELYKTWRVKWHRFIDKLADGGTAEQFFDEL